MGNEGTQSSLLLGVICPQHPRGRQSRTPKREGKSYMSSKEVLDTKNDLIEGVLNFGAKFVGVLRGGRCDNDCGHSWVNFGQPINEPVADLIPRQATGDSG
jgi:hypothetical protein